MGLGMITALSLFLDHFQPVQVSSDSPAELERLGVFLEALGSESEKEFDLLCREMACKYWANQSYTYSSLLEEYGDKPSQWAEQTERVAAFAREQALNGEPFVPFEIAQGHSAEQGLPRFQVLVRQYGRLLQYWSHLHRAAQEIAPRLID